MTQLIVGVCRDFRRTMKSLGRSFLKCCSVLSWKNRTWRLPIWRHESTCWPDTLYSRRLWRILRRMRKWRVLSGTTTKQASISDIGWTKIYVIVSQWRRRLLAQKSTTCSPHASTSRTKTLDWNAPSSTTCLIIKSTCLVFMQNNEAPSNISACCQRAPCKFLCNAMYNLKEERKYSWLNCIEDIGLIESLVLATHLLHKYNYRLRVHHSHRIVF